jgi:hypothetical protein
MMVYLSSGELSYWDIESGNMTNTFNAPAGLLSPVLFSNSRYLAGVNRQGLSVVHAVSGEVLATDNTVPGDSFLYSSGNDFFCLIQKNAEAELCRYTINNSGDLVTLDRFPLSPPSDGRYTAAALNGNGTTGGLAVLGTSGGAVATFDGQAPAIQTLTVSEKTKITDADVSGTDIAFLAENSTLGFIPRDYTSLSNGSVLRLEQNKEGYNRIVAFTGEDGDGGQFIFWQDRNNRTQPRLRPADPSAGVPVTGNNLRSPVRSVFSFAGKILFLDSAGNLSVVTPLNPGGRRPFTFSSVGLIDAAFIDSNRIILARSAVSGNTPFLLLNISTGETVPLPHPSRAGVAVHCGTSGNIYAAVVSSRPGTDGGEDTVVTSVVQIDLANSAESVTFTEFQGEAAQFSFAESQGFLAAAVSGESAIIHSTENIQKPDRTPGLPLRFIDGGPYLISLDSAGNICWHESGNGTLLAVFSLSPDGWTLQTERRTIGGTVSSEE